MFVGGGGRAGDAAALISLDVLSLVCSERTTWPSGSYFSDWVGDLGHVDVGADLDPRLADADHAFHQALDPLLDAILDRRLGVGRRLAAHRGVVVRRKGLAVLVDDRDALGLQVRHRAGDQVSAPPAPGRWRAHAPPTPIVTEAVAWSALSWNNWRSGNTKWTLRR